MALADLANRTNVSLSNACNVCYALKTIEPAQALDLERALANPLVQYEEIASELSALGISVAADGVGRHVRGQCSCGHVYRERRVTKRRG